MCWWRFQWINPQIHPRWLIGDVFSMRRLSCYSKNYLIMYHRLVGSVFWGFSVPCTFKTTTIDSEKKNMSIVAATDVWVDHPYSTLNTFPVAVKSHSPGCPIPSIVLYIFINCWACSCFNHAWSSCIWLLSSHQSGIILRLHSTFTTRRKDREIHSNLCVEIFVKYDPNDAFWGVT